jgi:hypothetical protein
VIRNILGGLFSLVGTPPRYWPKWWRRAFLLTLPISGPIWLSLIVAVLAICGFGMFIAAIASSICKICRDIWHAIWRELIDMW